MSRPRVRKRDVLRRLDGVREPVALFDSKRTLLYCNSACAAWLGIKADEGLAEEATYRAGHSGGDVADALAALCPPPECLAGERVSSIVHSPAEQESPYRLAEFQPLAGENGGYDVLVVLRADEGEAANRSAMRSAESQALHAELQRLRDRSVVFAGLAQGVGRSPGVVRLREQVQLAMGAAARVTVVGPSGSGREHIARAIHYGERASSAGPLVPLTSALLDAELVQTTVTALARRCDGERTTRPGALLLLDADQMPAEAQAELVGFLTLPTFSLHTIATCATPLRRLAKSGSFHRELASLLTTLEIEVPPLTDRREDISLLAQHYLEEWNAEGGRQLSGLTSEALDVLFEQSWRGDLEELRSVVREGAAKAKGSRVAATDLPLSVRTSVAAATWPSRRPESIDLGATLAEVEAELIRRALSLARGNKARASRLLGISRPRLLRRIEQLGLGPKTGSSDAGG